MLIMYLQLTDTGSVKQSNITTVLFDLMQVISCCFHDWTAQHKNRSTFKVLSPQDGFVKTMQCNRQF